MKNGYFPVRVVTIIMLLPAMLTSIALAQGFVPPIVEKRLAERFITQLSSQEQVRSDGFEELG